jgi:peptidoglycan/xylan/chitin deacetylase (PgdA/CDA1 family)
MLMHNTSHTRMAHFRMIPNKREFLARALGALGVVGLLERLVRRPGLLVVTYHRIGAPQENAFYDPVYSAGPEAFRAQVQALRDSFRLLRLDELVDLIQAGLPLRGPAALITFDDGYRDNVELALPILEELGVPAAFFLATGFLERPRLPWWDRIAYVIKNTRASTLALALPTPLEIDLVNTPRSQAIWRVVEGFMATPGCDEPTFFAQLEERAQVEVSTEALGRELFMTWDQARRLSEAGMAIGSHAHDHANLALLPEQEQLGELRQSKAILEREIGCEVTALAYPYGGAGAYTHVTQRVAREAGYQLAFTAQRGINRPGRTRPFALARVSVGYADSPTLVHTRNVLYAAFGSSLV